MRLMEALKRRLYEKKCGKEALLTSRELNEDYNPLNF
jgi:hypothetical protein